MYVLATVPRALTCVNIRTESPELVPLTLEVEPESQAEADLPPVMHLVSPIILPVAIDKIRRITVDDERHFGFSLYPRCGC